VAVTTEEGGLPRVQTFSTRSAARILAVSPDRIRYWVKRRLVEPSARRGRRFRFAFNDLLLMRMAKDLLPRHHHVGLFQRCFDRVRDFLEAGRPVTSIKLHNDEGRIVLSDGAALIEIETGQMLLRFGPHQSGTIEDRFGPARVRERFEEARRMAETDPLRALTLYSDLLGREPSNFEAHMRMATLLEHEGDLAGALRHLLGAAVIVPANTEVNLRLGTLYRLREESENALQSFQRAVECDPLSIEAHRQLAELYDRAGRKRESLRHLSAIHRLSRDKH
jgi:MerR-like DNA binding protein/tetratricopeptide repeat protein